MINWIEKRNIPFLKKLKESSFLANVATLISGSLISHGIILVSAPVLTRIYSPQDFGLYGLYTSIVSVLVVIASFKYEAAIMLPKKNKNAQNLLFLSVFIVIFISILSFILLFFLKDFLINKINIESFIYLIPIGVLLGGLTQALTSWNSRNKKYWNISNSKILSSSSAVSTQITIKSFDFSSIGLILGAITGNIINFSTLLFSSLKSNTLKMNYISKKRLFFNLKKYKNFPKYQMLANLIYALSQNIAIILITLLYSPIIAGFYALTVRVLVFPANLIGQSIKEVYYQRATESYHKTGCLKDIFIKTTLGLIKLYFFPLLLFAIFSPTFFTFFFGKNWIVSGTLAQFSVISTFSTLINTPASISLLILNLQKFSMLHQAISVMFKILAIYLGYKLFHNYYASIGLYSLAEIVSTFVLISYLYVKINKIKPLE